MTKLIPPANPGWPDVTRFEVVERLLGGDGGALNRAPLELLERSEFLKKKIDDAISGTLAFEYANRLKTGRTISMSGDGTWTVTFDGSANVTAAMTLTNSGVAAGSYQKVTVDAKGRVTAGINPTTLGGYGITDAQPLDAELTAIAALITTGMIVRTGAGTVAVRSVVAGTGISVTNGDGVAGNPTIALSVSGVAAGTYPKVTVDTYGRVTAGAALAAADIPALDWSKITTGKPTTVAGYGITDGATKTDVTNAAPSGAVAYFAMSAAPAGWLKANGAAVSRASYANLFNAITIQTTGNTTAGSNSVTAVASTTGLANGMPISGPGIPAGTTVTGFTANTITLSSNATATAIGVALVVAPFGVGDGSTTFNLPDLRGEFVRGWDDGRGVDSSRVFGSNQISTQVVVDDDGGQVVGAIDWGSNNLTSLGYETAQASGVTIHFANSTTTNSANPSTFLRSIRPRNVAMLACIKF